MINVLRNRIKKAAKIREAINFLPSGLCFYKRNGMTILVNRMMNDIAFQLTGEIIINAEMFWQMAYEKRIENILSGYGGKPCDNADNVLIFKLPDTSVWQLRKTVINSEEDEIIQLDASNVTELYETIQKCNEKNRSLLKLYKKTKNVLNNIVSVNRKKELLHVKMAIHDEFGEVVTATTRMLESGDYSDSNEIIENWEVVLKLFSDISESGEKNNENPVNELIRVSKLIRCDLKFEGELPERSREKKLLCAAIREALTNAVRHAHASVLTIKMSENRDILSAEIYSNGSIFPESVREGNGLTNLRCRLEKAGVTLNIICDKCRGVIIYLEFPKVW